MGFAGDWIPFGEEAAARYRQLKWNPILPHQQLLCLEAMELTGWLACTVGRGDVQATHSHPMFHLVLCRSPCVIVPFPWWFCRAAASPGAESRQC
jgi:hypothetical protein